MFGFLGQTQSPHTLYPYTNRVSHLKSHSNIADYILFTVTKSRSKNIPQRTCQYNTGNDHKCFGGGPVRLAFIFWWEFTLISNINIFLHLIHYSEFQSLIRFWYKVFSKRYLPTACVGVLCCSFYWHFLPLNRSRAMILTYWRVEASYGSVLGMYRLLHRSSVFTYLPLWSYIHDHHCWLNTCCALYNPVCMVRCHI